MGRRGSILATLVVAGAVGVQLLIGGGGGGVAPVEAAVDGEPLRTRRVDAGADAPTCCKVCRKGCACGDSCISCEKKCHKGPGCACNE
jgi:hypothetical protein